MGGKLPTAGDNNVAASRAQEGPRAVRRVSRRHRGRPPEGGTLWGQFHQWMHDESIEAVVIESNRALYLLRAGDWQGLPTPFARDQQVRELVRRLTLAPRRTQGPVYRQLPEGFDLFSWHTDAFGRTVVLLRRVRPTSRPRMQLASMLSGDGSSVRLLGRWLSRREPVLVCGPGQHARERVLEALTGLLAAERRVVWFVDARRPLAAPGAAAVLTVDFHRLYGQPNLAQDLLEQAAALGADDLVIQETPPPLLAALPAWLAEGRRGVLAACAFPLDRVMMPGRAGHLWARSQDVPDAFRWIVEVAGYRRPVVAGIWRAMPGSGPERWWHRLPLGATGHKQPSRLPPTWPPLVSRRWLRAFKTAETSAPAYALGKAGERE